MSNQNDDSIPNDPVSETPDPSSSDNSSQPPVDRPDDWWRETRRSPWNNDAKYGYESTRSSYMELHGDIHDGQEPPEEKD